MNQENSPPTKKKVFWRSAMKASLVNYAALVIFGMLLVAFVLPQGSFLNAMLSAMKNPAELWGLILIISFLNVLDVIILTAVQMFWTQFSYLEAIGTLSLVIGFFLIFIANIVLFYVAIKKAFSAVGVNINAMQVVKMVAGPATAAM